MPDTNSKNSLANNIFNIYLLFGEEIDIDADPVVWYIQYDKLKDKTDVLITPFGVQYVDSNGLTVIKDLQEASVVFDNIPLSKPNDILEQFTEISTAYGICDFSDKNSVRTFDVKNDQSSILLGLNNNKYFSLTNAYTYQFTISIDDYYNQVTQRKDETFFQKYGHADIVLKNKKGATGQGTLEIDGYSIGWKETILFQDDQQIEYTFRGNYDCSNEDFTKKPTFMVIIRSNFDCNIKAHIISKDPDFEGIPDVPIKVKANNRADVVFSANKVMNTSEDDSTIEIDPEVHDKPVNNDYLLNVPKTFYRSVPVLESIGYVEDIRIQKNGAIEIKSFNYNDNLKMPKITYKQVWVGLALDDSEKNCGQDYWYLVGGEDENPYYRVIKKYIGQYQDEYEGFVVGYIKDLDLDYKVSVIIKSNQEHTIQVKVELQSSNDLNGYLDIISDIKFGFYNDGPIKINLPSNKLFTFIGH